MARWRKRPRAEQFVSPKLTREISTAVGKETFQRERSPRSRGPRLPVLPCGALCIRSFDLDARVRPVTGRWSYYGVQPSDGRPGIAPCSVLLARPGRTPFGNRMSERGELRSPC